MFSNLTNLDKIYLKLIRWIETDAILLLQQTTEIMRIQTTLQSTRIKISEPMVADVYYIEQEDDNKRYYIVSENGYNGYEGNGHATLEEALKNVKSMIKNYFVDRGEENPKGF
jgi:hypothetical protein